MGSFIKTIWRVIGTIFFGFLAMGAAASIVAGGPDGVTGENALMITVASLVALGAVVWFFWFRKRTTR